MDSRTIIWINRFSYFGYVGLATVFAISLFGIVFIGGLRVVGWFEFGLIMCVGTGVWSFYNLKNQNPLALLLCKIVTALLLLMHAFLMFKLFKTLLSSSVISGMLESFTFFTQIANAVTTSVFMLWCIILVLRFLLPLDSEIEEKREFPIDLHVYTTAILTALSFGMAALNHLQIDVGGVGLNVKISAGGIVLMGFTGWKVLHYILLAASISLIITSVLRLDEMASKICISVAVIFAMQTPIAMYAAMTSKFAPQFNMKIMMLAPLLLIFAGFVTLFYWLADSFKTLHEIRNMEEVPH